MKPTLAPWLRCVLALGVPSCLGALPTLTESGPIKAILNGVEVGSARPGSLSTRPQVQPVTLHGDSLTRAIPELLAAASSRDHPPRSTGSAQASLKPEEQRLLSKMAAEGTNAPGLYALADFCHDEGVDGDKQAVLRAEGYLRKLLELDPKHTRALALLGSVYTMKGRDAFWPTTQIKLVKEGNGYMDKAVAQEPEDIPTRTIRALNNAHMPEFLGRAQIVREDLAWLWGKIEKGGAPITTSAKQQLALHWGRNLKRQHKVDDAVRVFRTGRDFAPDSPVATEISVELEKLR